jgi:hypothetical protein
VDLLKLLTGSTALYARAKLAEELGFNDGAFTGDADQNEWLHARVVEEVASRGIALPTA